MATYTVFTYCCPRCKADIGRRFGLITTPSIICPQCGTTVRIDRNVIAQNWGYNFAWVSGLLIWAGLAIAVLADQQFAAKVGNKTLPAATMQNRLVIAGFCAIPALLAGLVCGGVGMMLGMIVSVAPSETSTAANRQAGGSPRLGAGFATGSSPTDAPEPPRERGLLVRAFFVLLWPIVVFFGGALAVGLVWPGRAIPEPPAEVVGAGTVGLIGSPHGQGPLLAATSLIPQHVKDQQRQHQAAQVRGEKTAPWLLLGTLVAFILGCLGLMPSTSRKRRGLGDETGSGAVAQNAPLRAGRLDVRNAPVPSGPQRRPRSYLVRGFFVLFWPSAFFLVAAGTMSTLAGGVSPQSEAVHNQLIQQSAQTHAGWVALVALLLFVLGCVGCLPWTGRMKRT
jgi:hypothetical protein